MSNQESQFTPHDESDDLAWLLAMKDHPCAEAEFKARIDRIAVVLHGAAEKDRSIEELYSALQHDRRIYAETPWPAALREATAIGLAALFAYCGAYKSLTEHQKLQWDRLRELAKLSDIGTSPSSVPSETATINAAPPVKDLAASIGRESGDSSEGNRAGAAPCSNFDKHYRSIVDNAEVIGNVTAALIDLDATYDGNRVTFTFLSTKDAMSHIQKARRIVEERLSMIRAARDAIEEANHFANAGNMVQSATGAIELLKAAACPNCNGSGAIPHQISDEGDYELEQCQWCFERNLLVGSPSKPQPEAGPTLEWERLPEWHMLSHGPVHQWDGDRLVISLRRCVSGKHEDEEWFRIKLPPLPSQPMNVVPK